VSNGCGGAVIAPALVGTIGSQLGGVVIGQVTGSVQLAVEGPRCADICAAARRSVPSISARQRRSEPRLQ